MPQSEREAGKKAEYEYSWGRQNWFDYAQSEHMAVREKAGLFDLSTFGKIKVIGRDAEKVLQHLCANDVAVPQGRIVYTQMLNRRGGIEADVTVTRLSETEFLVITPAATIRRDLGWIERHIPEHHLPLTTQCTSAEASTSYLYLGE